MKKNTQNVSYDIFAQSPSNIINFILTMLHQRPNAYVNVLSVHFNMFGMASWPKHLLDLIP